MIRRDYLVRMVDECVQALARSLGLIRQSRFEEARQEVHRAIRDLTGLDASQIRSLSEAELMSRLLRGEPTQILRQKCMLLVALLRQAGETHSGQGDLAASRACNLKALNLALEVLAREGAFAYPEFVPSIEALTGALAGDPLPLPTSAALLQHYEEAGQFAKAEDALFAMLDQRPDAPALRDFGRQFYRRLLRRSDEALNAGNLPRDEVEGGLAELDALEPS